MVTYLSRMLVLPILVTSVSIADVHSSPFPYQKCITSPSASQHAVLPYVMKPAPNTYCFILQARAYCSSSQNSCCRKGNIANFILHANPLCDGAVITATLNNRPLPNVVISRPATAPGTRRVLTVPGLNLNATTIGDVGAQLCLKLPSSGNCSSFYRLAVGGSAWSAALISSDGKCCPVSRGRPKPLPAKGTCQSCFVWEVVGPDDTTATAKYDFLSRNNCLIGAVEPLSGVVSCCQYAGDYLKTSMFVSYKEKGIILGGFDRAVCDRSSLRMCGTIASEEVGQAMIIEWEENGLGGYTTYAYDITDDMCPMALIDATVRFYSAVPGSNAFDNRCTPFSYTIPGICVRPARDEWEYDPGIKPFPNDKSISSHVRAIYVRNCTCCCLPNPAVPWSHGGSCDSTPGSTPFMVEPYEDVRFGNTTDLYCINVATVMPVQPQSACGKSTRIDRMSFWLYDTKESKKGYLGVYLLALKGGDYAGRRLKTSWGPDGDKAMFISALGLDLATVKSSRPKICFEREKGSDIGYDSVDGSHFMWTALYDSSGKCCPTYYSNIY